MNGIVVLSVALIVASVSGSPAVLKSVKKRANNLPLIPGDGNVESLNLLKTKKWRLQPVAVKQVESYGPHGEKTKVEEKSSKRAVHGGPQTFSRHESSSSSFSNINGDIKSSSRQAEKVHENGELLKSIERMGQQYQQPGQQPHSQELTDVEIPQYNIHERVMNKDGQLYPLPQQQQQQLHQKRAQDGEEEEEMLVRIATDLAEYIEKTGDETGVVNFISALMQEGKMNEEEGLLYLELIKEIIDQQEQVNRENAEEAEREIEAQRILSFSDYLDSEYQAGSLSRAAYTDLKDRLMESVLEKAEEDPEFLANPNHL